MLCHPHDKAFNALYEKYKRYCCERDVIIIRLPNSAGQLFRVLELLRDHCINLTYSYQAGGQKGYALVVFELQNQDKTTETKLELKKAGFDLLEKLGAHNAGIEDKIERID
jgi:hypothetical protein